MAVWDDEAPVYTSYPAGADFQRTATADYQYRCLKLGTDGEVELCAKGDAPVGFLAMDPEGGVGTQASVLYDAAKHTAVAHAAVAVGDLVITQADGRLGPKAALSASGTDWVYGIAVTAASAQGDHFKVQPLRSGSIG